MSENTESWAVYSTSTPMCGRGKSSLWHALFRSMYYTHILNFPSFFRTGTILATHCGYLAMAKNPASNYFLTSSLILRDMSSLVLLNFCLTRGHSGLSGSLCITMIVSSPGMSWYDQANAISYSCKSLTNLYLILSFKATPTLTSFPFSLVPRLITSTSSWWGWISLSSCFNSLANSSGSSQSSSFPSSAWLIGN